MTTPTFHNMKTVDSFSGNAEEDFTEFLSSFERLAIANSWTDDLRCKFFGTYLTGPAADELLKLTPAQRTKFDDIVDHYKSKYSPPELKSVYKTELHAAKMGATETVKKYQDRVEKLGKQAYPDYDMQHRSSLLKDVFLSGLRPDILLLTNTMQPKTYDQAVLHARQTEATLKQTATALFSPRTSTTTQNLANNSQATMAPRNHQNDMPQNEAQSYEVLHRLDGLSSSMQQLSASIGQQQHPQQSRESRQQQQQPPRGILRNHSRARTPNNREWTHDGRPICHYCHRAGHVRAVCRTRQRDQGLYYQPNPPNQYYGSLPPRPAQNFHPSGGYGSQYTGDYQQRPYRSAMPTYGGNNNPPRQVQFQTPNWGPHRPATQPFMGQGQQSSHPSYSQGPYSQSAQQYGGGGHITQSPVFYPPPQTPNYWQPETYYNPYAPESLPYSNYEHYSKPFYHNEAVHHPGFIPYSQPPPTLPPVETFSPQHQSHVVPEQVVPPDQRSFMHSLGSTGDAHVETPSPPMSPVLPICRDPVDARYSIRGTDRFMAVGPYVYVDVQINGTMIRGIGDSAASMSFMSAATWALLGYPTLYPLQGESPRSLDNGLIPVIGVFPATLTLFGKTIHALINVQDDSPHQLLLGTNVLSQCGPQMLIDWQKRTMFLPEPATPSEAPEETTIPKIREACAADIVTSIPIIPTSANDTTQNYQAPPANSRQSRRRANGYAQFPWLFTFLLWLSLFFSPFGVTAHLDQRPSYPMVCSYNGQPQIWKFPEWPSCPELPLTINEDPVPKKISLFRENHSQYRTDTWLCEKVRRTVEVFTYFFNDENLKRESLENIPVSRDECQRMIEYHTCDAGDLHQHGTIWHTNHELKWEYPGGGINCCKWYKHVATNCFLSPTVVIKRHDNQQMESPAGLVTHCKYGDGYCAMENGRILLWTPSKSEQCAFLKWKTLRGQMLNGTWLSNDGNLALTFTQTHDEMRDCRGSRLYRSDQGIVYQWPWLRKRRSSHNLSQNNPADTAVVAAQLQALQTRLQSNVQLAFQQAYYASCSRMQHIVSLVRIALLGQPTLSSRFLLNSTALDAKVAGEFVQIYPREHLSAHLYTILPMNTTCYRSIPIRLQHSHRSVIGYIDPETNIISFIRPSEISCSSFTTIPVILNHTLFIYLQNGSLSQTSSVHTFPSYGFRFNISLALPQTVFHQVMMYSWKEMQSPFSLNDLAGQLHQQRELLRAMGLSPTPFHPDGSIVSFDHAAARWVRTGFFGFLRGLSVDAWQVWVFLCCFCVTLYLFIQLFRISRNYLFRACKLDQVTWPQMPSFLSQTPRAPMPPIRKSCRLRRTPAFRRPRSEFRRSPPLRRWPPGSTVPDSPPLLPALPPFLSIDELPPPTFHTFRRPQSIEMANTPRVCMYEPIVQFPDDTHSTPAANVDGSTASQIELIRKSNKRCGSLSVTNTPTSVFASSPSKMPIHVSFSEVKAQFDFVWPFTSWIPTPGYLPSVEFITDETRATEVLNSITATSESSESTLNQIVAVDMEHTQKENRGAAYPYQVYDHRKGPYLATLQLATFFHAPVVIDVFTLGLFPALRRFLEAKLRILLFCDPSNDILAVYRSFNIKVGGRIVCVEELTSLLVIPVEEGVLDLCVDGAPDSDKNDPNNKFGFAHLCKLFLDINVSADKKDFQAMFKWGRDVPLRNAELIYAGQDARFLLDIFLQIIRIVRFQTAPTVLPCDRDLVGNLALQICTRYGSNWTGVRSLQTSIAEFEAAGSRRPYQINDSQIKDNTGRRGATRMVHNPRPPPPPRYSGPLDYAGDDVPRVHVSYISLALPDFPAPPQPDQETDEEANLDLLSNRSFDSQYSSPGSNDYAEILMGPSASEERAFREETEALLQPPPTSQRHREMHGATSDGPHSSPCARSSNTYLSRPALNSRSRVSPGRRDQNISGSCRPVYHTSRDSDSRSRRRDSPHRPERRPTHSSHRNSQYRHCQSSGTRSPPRRQRANASRSRSPPSCRISRCGPSHRHDRPADPVSSTGGLHTASQRQNPSSHTREPTAQFGRRSSPGPSRSDGPTYQNNVASTKCGDPNLQRQRPLSPPVEPVPLFGHYPSPRPGRSTQASALPSLKPRGRARRCDLSYPQPYPSRGRARKCENYGATFSPTPGTSSLRNVSTLRPGSPEVELSPQTGPATSVDNLEEDVFGFMRQRNANESLTPALDAVYSARDAHATLPPAPRPSFYNDPLGHFGTFQTPAVTTTFQPRPRSPQTSVFAPSDFGPFSPSSPPDRQDTLAHTLSRRRPHSPRQQKSPRPTQKRFKSAQKHADKETSRASIGHSTNTSTPDTQPHTSGDRRRSRVFVNSSMVSRAPVSGSTASTSATRPLPLLSLPWLAPPTSSTSSGSCVKDTKCVVLKSPPPGGRPQNTYQSAAFLSSHGLRATHSSANDVTTPTRRNDHQNCEQMQAQDDDDAQKRRAHLYGGSLTRQEFVEDVVAQMTSPPIPEPPAQTSAQFAMAPPGHTPWVQLNKYLLKRLSKMSATVRSTARRLQQNIARGQTRRLPNRQLVGVHIRPFIAVERNELIGVFNAHTDLNEQPPFSLSQLSYLIRLMTRRAHRIVNTELVFPFLLISNGHREYFRSRERQRRHISLRARDHAILEDGTLENRRYPHTPAQPRLDLPPSLGQGRPSGRWGAM